MNASGPSSGGGVLAFLPMVIGFLFMCGLVAIAKVIWPRISGAVEMKDRRKARDKFVTACACLGMAAVAMMFGVSQLVKGADTRSVPGLFGMAVFFAAVGVYLLSRLYRG